MRFQRFKESLAWGLYDLSLLSSQFRLRASSSWVSNVKNAKCQMFVQERHSLALTEADLPEPDSRIFCPKLWSPSMAALDPWFCHPWISVCTDVTYMCLCECVHLFVQPRIQVCACPCMWRPCFFETGSHTEPDSSRLAGQWASVTYLSLPPQNWITDIHSHTQLLTWVLGSQVLMVIW